MKTLDRSRPFGEICGSLTAMPAARYDQDGLWFDANGNLLGCDEVVPPPDPAALTSPNLEALNSSRQIKPDEGPNGQILALHKDGKSPIEIRKITGIHHKKVEKIIKDADAQSDITVA